MIHWTYDHKDYMDGGFKPIRPGQYRVRINNAEETTSKTGRDMIKMTLDVSGYPSKVYYYMVFMSEYKEQTNKRLGDIYASFDIPQGDLEPIYWIGKVGAAQISNEVNDGKTQNRVDFFIPKSKQDALPPWNEAGGKGGGAIVPEMLDLGEGEVDVPF